MQQMYYVGLVPDSLRRQATFQSVLNGRLVSSTLGG